MSVNLDSTTSFNISMDTNHNQPLPQEASTKAYNLGIKYIHLVAETIKNLADKTKEAGKSYINTWKTYPKSMASAHLAVALAALCYLNPKASHGLKQQATSFKNWITNSTPCYSFPGATASPSFVADEEEEATL